MRAGALRGRREGQIPLELELQEVVRLSWVLRTDLRSSALPVTVEPSLQLSGLHFYWFFVLTAYNKQIHMSGSLTESRRRRERNGLLLGKGLLLGLSKCPRTKEGTLYNHVITKNFNSTLMVCKLYLN